MRKSTVIKLMLLSLLALAGVSSASSPAGDVKEGKDLYEQEKYDEAAEKFGQAQEESPESDIVNYNLGAALYKKGQYKEAAEAFTRALVTEDRALEAKAIYNLANSTFQLGSQTAGADPNSAISMYRESLDYYKRALELDETDRDAKFNHELVEKKLKILLDQMKNQKKNEQEENDQEDGHEQSQDSKQAQEEKGEQKEAQQEQGQQQNDESQEGMDKGEDQKEAAPSVDGKDDTAKMSPGEARMILDAYGQEEAREDVKNKGRARIRGVYKDW